MTWCSVSVTRASDQRQVVQYTLRDGLHQAASLRRLRPVGGRRGVIGGGQRGQQRRRACRAGGHVIAVTPSRRHAQSAVQPTWFTVATTVVVVFVVVVVLVVVGGGGGGQRVGRPRGEAVAAVVDASQHAGDGERAAGGRRGRRRRRGRPARLPSVGRPPPPDDDEEPGPADGALPRGQSRDRVGPAGSGGRRRRRRRHGGGHHPVSRHRQQSRQGAQVDAPRPGHAGRLSARRHAGRHASRAGYVLPVTPIPTDHTCRQDVIPFQFPALSSLIQRLKDNPPLLPHNPQISPTSIAYLSDSCQCTDC